MASASSAGGVNEFGAETEPPVVKKIRINRIRLPENFGLEEDEGLVVAVGSTCKLHGLNSVIIVSRLSKASDDGHRYELVAGRIRVAAYIRNGQTEIHAIILEGGRRLAKLVQLGENLWRRQSRVLDRADALIAYLELALEVLEQRLPEKDQPKSIYELADRLGILSRTTDGRRMIIKRAKKIAMLSPEAKTRARRLGLDNNQDALQAAAKAGKRIANQCAVLTKRSKDKHADPVEADGDDDEADKVQEESDEEDPTDVASTFEEMEGFWHPEGAKIWRRLPAADRERFISSLYKSRCVVAVDLNQLVDDLFFGRGEIEIADLDAWARRQYVAPRRLREAVRAAGHQRRRRGADPHGAWYYKNKNTEWKNEYPKRVTKKQLKRAKSIFGSDETLEPYEEAQDEAERPSRKLDPYYDLN
jgi:ParB-like chromosome segregation protein Spo0J